MHSPPQQKGRLRHVEGHHIRRRKIRNRQNAFMEVLYKWDEKIKSWGEGKRKWWKIKVIE